MPASATRLSGRKVRRKTTARAAASPAPRSGALGGWTVVILLALLVTFGYSATAWHNQPDPHFLKAQKIVRDYEVGRDPETLNYDDPAYASALDELALVDPDSVSFPAAQQLRAEITHWISFFHESIQKREARMVAQRLDEERRTLLLEEAQRAATGADPGAARRAAREAEKSCREEDAQLARRRHKR